jgi:hypothetical protein
MINYRSDIKQICLETEKGETIILTKEVMESVCAYFNENYGTCENLDGRINYEYKY